jgi:hypothetical protein
MTPDRVCDYLFARPLYGLPEPENIIKDRCEMGRKKYQLRFRRLVLIGLNLLIGSASVGLGTPFAFGGQVQESPPGTDESQTRDSDAKQAPQKSPERIFGVIPSDTITDAQNAPPLVAKQKFALFAKGTLDFFPIAVYSFQAGVSQARDSHSGYGQGASGYGKRFGAALADGTSARFFGTYAFPVILHQDPRYFRKNEGSGWSRVRYSVSRVVITRADSGKKQANWSNLLGKLTAGGLSNLYYPSEDRGAGLTLSRIGISFAYQTIGNLAIEFWPEIRRKLSRGKKENAAADCRPN